MLAAAARAGVLLLVLGLGFHPARRPAGAQEPGAPLPAALPPAAAAAQEPISPGTAFLRALLIPGWGHASIGAHTRGGFYFLTESASLWMMVRTRARLGAAKEARDLRLSEVAARLAAAGVTDPAAVAAAQDDDPFVAGARSLVEARAQQFEDWLVLGVFLVFLGGADAFVSAHLRDFPGPVRMQVRAGEGALDLGGVVRLRLGP